LGGHPVYKLIYKRYKVVTSEVPFLTKDGRNHLRYSLHLLAEGWPGWVGMSSLDIYPPKVVTNPSTNRARRSLTSLMRQTPLPLRQTSKGSFRRRSQLAIAR